MAFSIKCWQMTLNLSNSPKFPPSECFAMHYLIQYYQALSLDPIIQNIIFIKSYCMLKVIHQERIFSGVSCTHI